MELACIVPAPTLEEIWNIHRLLGFFSYEMMSLLLFQMVKQWLHPCRAKARLQKKFIGTHATSKAGFTASSSLQGLSEWDANENTPPKPSPNASACGLVLFQSPPATSTAGPAPLALLAHLKNLLFQFQVLFLPFLWEIYIILVTHACRSDLLGNYFVPKKKPHCWLQVKTYPCISPASQCQLSDFGEVWGRWRSEDGKLKYVKQGSPSAVFKDHSQFLPTCFVII